MTCEPGHRATRRSRLRALLVALLGFTALGSQAAPPTSSTQLSDFAHGGGGTVGQIRFTPDGRKVCFLADIDTTSQFDLWCSDSDQPAVALRGHDLNLVGTLLFRLVMGSDSEFAYFATDRAIYRANLETRTGTLMSGPPSQTADILDWSFDEATGYLVYTLREAGARDLLAVSLDAPGQVVRLTDTIKDFASIAAVRRSPSGDRLFFLGKLEGENTALFTTTYPGGQVQQVSLLAPVDDYEVTPDGSRLIYRVQGRLYHVPASGGTVQELSEPTFNNFAVFAPYFPLPDSSGVVYFGNEDSDTVIELKRARFSGGLPTVLDVAINIGTVQENLVLQTPDGQRLIYYRFLGLPFPETKAVATLDLTGPGMPVDYANSGSFSYRYFAAGDVVAHTGKVLSDQVLYLQPADASSQVTIFQGPDTNFPTPLAYAPVTQRLIWSRRPNGVATKNQYFSTRRDGTGEVALTSDVDAPFFVGLQFIVNNVADNITADGRGLLTVENREIPTTVNGVLRQESRLQKTDLETGKIRILATESFSDRQAVSPNISFVVPSPTDPDVLVYLADTEINDRRELFLVRFNREIFDDGFDPP